MKQLEKIKHLQEQVLNYQTRYSAALEVIKKFENKPDRLVTHILTNTEARIRKGKSQRAHLRQLAKAYERLLKDYAAMHGEAIEWKNKSFKIFDSEKRSIK